MDKNSQPGIRITDIILAESIFHRISLLPKKVDFNLTLNLQRHFDSENHRLVIELSVTLNKEHAPIYCRVKYVGIFDQTKDSNMSLEDFSKLSAPSLIIPYVREEIHSRFMKAGLGNTFILPPINLQALLKKEDVK